MPYALHPCADCGAPIRTPHTRCGACATAWRKRAPFVEPRRRGRATPPALSQATTRAAVLYRAALLRADEDVPLYQAALLRARAADWGW
jgi:hypothetical protein